MAKGQTLLWAGSRAARGKITVSGIPNRLNYCESFIMYIKLANVAAGHITQPGGPRVEDSIYRTASLISYTLVEITKQIVEPPMQAFLTSALDAWE
jgi:hypothetical protein